MRLVLVSTIPNGYAEREFKGIQYCLNSVEEGFCELVNNENVDTFEKRLDDFYIVADYCYNPVFKKELVSPKLYFFIQTLYPNKTAIYYSDPLFKFENPSDFPNWDYFVFFGLSRYRKTKTEDYKNCRIWENIDISKKKILNIPIPELAFWSYIQMNDGSTDFKKIDPKHTLTYIINSKILARKKLLDFLDGKSCQLGNFPVIDNKDIQSFVERNPKCTWLTQKAFGLDFLFLQDGKFTIVQDDDIPIKAAWPMRFYEAMSVGVIPMINSEKGCDYIYNGYKFLSRCCFNGVKDFNEKLKNAKQCRSSLLAEAEKFMEKYVYDKESLFDQTVTEIAHREDD